MKAFKALAALACRESARPAQSPEAVICMWLVGRAFSFC